MRYRYDVIVAGAGPSGSTAARECASRGMSVLMLDKSEFPRDKPCGGGVIHDVLDLLPFELTPVIESTVSATLFSYGPFLRFTKTLRDPLFLTQRVNLDSFLVERAVEAGVVLKERTPIRELERYPRHVVVRAGSETFEGKTLVAADGANGTTVKMAGMKSGTVNRIAIEVNASPHGGFPKEWKETFAIDQGSYPGGYGWLFPKGDHLNIGLGGYKCLGPTLRHRLNQLTRFYGYDPAGLWGVRGHYIPVRKHPTPLASGNVLMVGDAGGLVESRNGEGIYGVIWSGRSAARHLAVYLEGKTPDLAEYHRDVERDLFPYLQVSYGVE